MKFNLTLLAAALAVAACAPKAGKTTQVVGQFTENAPETVRIVLGETVDTTVAVTDGRFQVALPKDLTDFAYVETDFTPISFISDGSKITLDPVAGTAVSSNKKGAQAHYAAYNEWMLGEHAGFITGTDLLIDGGTIAAIRTGQYKLGR